MILDRTPLTMSEVQEIVNDLPESDKKEEISVFLKKFLKSNPDHSATRLQYAKVLIHTGAMGEAKKQLKKVLKKEKEESPLVQEAKFLTDRAKQ